MKYSQCLLLIFLIFASGTPLNAKKVCTNVKECADLYNSCQCYCSRKCGFRDKQTDDTPIFVPNDPAGHYCYCKQWDLDNVDACQPE
jgi:hypothetical protein